VHPFNVGFTTCSNWYDNQVIRNTIWLSKLEVVNGGLDEWDLLVSGDHGQLVLVEPDSLLAILDPSSDEHVKIQLFNICDKVLVE